ncbi:hypothetical protein ACFP1I_21850 [Dyadobacter subterraneus]|uniref:Uncharacterized protein n=1 Tax=Dyadobacter subterraneus TaxID=2773304 RepID=A0ABR9W554_9BACT|nr:hypothetical protein [Dyadobacter subterraneus]MBE9460592.1 hypothetical protein [Dyadobacter subterraneus]
MRFISEDDADVRPLWMSPQEINDPSEFIRQFCKTNSIVDCRFFLWQMLSNSISAKNPDVNASAGEQLYFFENLMPFIEAVFLLQHTDAKNILNEGSEDAAIAENLNNSVSDANCTVSNSPKFSIKFKKSRFKKKQRHIRNHSIWYREKIEDPIQVIRNFFDAYSLMNFKTYFYEVLNATSADHFYQKGSPSDVLYNLERLESIINVAYLINGENLEVTDIEPKPRVECSLKTNYEIFSSMLSKEEMLNPQEVLQSFFSYKSLKEWKETLIEINDFALSKHPAYEWGVWIDVLPVFIHSVKLAEVLYLIGNSQENDKK